MFLFLFNIFHEAGSRDEQHSVKSRAELAEKLERLSALNALLNMGEKGDDAPGMDDAPEEENGGHDYTMGSGGMGVAAAMAELSWLAIKKLRLI